MLLLTIKIPKLVKTNGAVSVIIPVAPKSTFTNEEKIIAIEIQIKSLLFFTKKRNYTKYGIISHKSEVNADFRF